MTTVADVRAIVAEMIKRSDQNDNIDREIIGACAELERKLTFISQVAEFTLTTVADQEWYTTLDLSSAIPAEGTNDSATLSMERVLRIEYLAGAPTGQTTTVEIRPLRFKEYQDLSEGAASAGWPTYYTVYGHRLGLWPVPSEVFTIQGDGIIKPVSPTSSSSESAFIDQAQDLVECMAASRICARYINDPRRAATYMGEAERLMANLIGEDTKKRSTGKLKASM